MKGIYSFFKFLDYGVELGENSAFKFILKKWLTGKMGAENE